MSNEKTGKKRGRPEVPIKSTYFACRLEHDLNQSVEKEIQRQKKEIGRNISKSAVVKGLIRKGLK